MTQGIPRRASLNETHAGVTPAVPGPQSGQAAEATASASARGMIEIHPALPKVNPNLVFGATMALWRPPRFTPQELLDTINELLDGTGTVAEFDEKMNMGQDRPKFSLLQRRLKGPPSVMLRVNGLFTLVGGGDNPAFVGQALKDRVNPALWSEDVQRLNQSRGHVMIADAHPPDPDDADLNYDRAVAVTVTAAAVSLLTDPLGIIWHPAGNATPPDVIQDFIQSLADGLAPLPLWLRWLLVPPTHGRSPGAASRGLEELLGLEIEIAPNGFFSRRRSPTCSRFPRCMCGLARCRPTARRSAPRTRLGITPCITSTAA